MSTAGDRSALPPSKTATEVILIRHGETEWNRAGRLQGQLNSPLTTNGSLQAEAMAARLSKISFSALYSSDLGRAMDTAGSISRATGRAITSVPALRERHFGLFQSMTYAEIEAKYPELYHQFKSVGPDFIVPEGESARQCQERSSAALEEIARRHAGERIAVVTHGGVLSLFFRHTMGLPLGAPRRYKVGNVAFNLFSYDAGKWIVETWGDVAHLSGIECRDDD